MLTSKLEYEEARRMFTLHTGGDPDTVLRKGLKKGKNTKGRWMALKNTQATRVRRDPAVLECVGFRKTITKTIATASPSSSKKGKCTGRTIYKPERALTKFKRGASKKKKKKPRINPSFTKEHSYEQETNMEEQINQDTGLTPREEEELLAIDEGGEVVIDEEDEALLNEWSSPLQGLIHKESIKMKKITEDSGVNIAGTKIKSLEGINPRTSTPLKTPELKKSSTSSKTSPNADLEELGSFKIPRTVSVTKTKYARKRPDPGVGGGDNRRIKNRT